MIPIAALLLTACAVSPDPIDRAEQIGRRDQTFVPSYADLLYDQQGWRVLEASNKERTVCVAIKPAPGTSWPDYTADLRAIGGGAGFVMLHPVGAALPYFGFYGRHFYGRKVSVTVDGQNRVSVDDRDTVLAWEGREIPFTVTTLPEADLYDQADRTSAAVDFTGITAAYEVLERCYQRVADGR